MAGSLETSYWCYMCRQRVIPIMDLELECPFCESGFVEEIARREAPEAEEAASAISSWPSILEGMVSNPHHSRSRILPRVDDDDNSDLEAGLEYTLGRRQREIDAYIWRARLEEGEEESDTEHQLETTAQRRQSSAILHLLYSLREDLRRESDQREIYMESERETLALLNSLNEAVILDGPFNPDQNQIHESESTNLGASVGDYFVGPGLEMLLQHLSENDTNFYGTPPAQKGAAEALPVVKIDENINCPVCLEDLEVGTQARKMPCNHKFHKDCIFPWLELHSSCPVCRFQLPADESKTVENRERGGAGNSSVRGRRYRSEAPPSWPFNGMF